jgi:hypothetical protein
MASYGVALIIIMAALAIIYKLSISGQDVFTPYCTPSPGFACNFYGMNQSGVLTLQMSQATGAPISVKGVACATAIDPNSYTPAFGNAYVTGNYLYYPTNSYPEYGSGNSDGTLVQSSGTADFNLYCYNGKSPASTRSLGSGINGYIWLNYSIPGTSVRVTQLIASFYTKYT